MASPAGEEVAVRPFRIDVPEEELVDLRRRIAATRWPERETVADQSQGVQLATIQELARYWATDYDWRKAEAKLNALPQFMTDAAVSGLFEQLLKDHLRLFVFALAELMMSDMPLRIDEIEGRPITVVESTPNRIVVIDRNRIIDPHILRSSTNVIDISLEYELGRVYADHDQSFILVFLGPRAEVGKLA